MPAVQHANAKVEGIYTMTHTVLAISTLLALGLADIAQPVLAADTATPPAPAKTGAVTPPPQTSNTVTPPPATLQSDVTPPPPQAPGSATTATPPAPDSIATLKMFKDKGADINYLGRKFGLDGWLVSLGNAIQVVYTTPDGQGTVVGLMYGPDGNIATAEQLVEAKEKGLDLQHTTSALNNAPGLNNVPDTGSAMAAMPPMTADVQTPAQAASMAGVPGFAGTSAPTLPSAAATLAGMPAAGAPTPSAANPSSPSERLWTQLTNSTYITFGSPSAPPLYVFMDPTCHFCHDYFSALMQTYVPQNAVQLRVIPVGILSDKSKQEAALIASAIDPAAAWTSAETGDTSTLPATPKPDMAQKLNDNQRLMSQWNFRGTPGSVYRGADGKVKVVYGLPQNLDQVIADLAKTSH